MITPSFSPTATERVLPKLALDFTTASLDPRVTFTRTTGASNPATYVNSSGYITNATNNQPRFDYDPIALTCKGLLIEESRTNSLKYSSDYSQSDWDKTAYPLTMSLSGVLGPDNTTNTYVGIPTANLIAHAFHQTFSFVSGSTYTISIFAKPNGYNFIQITTGLSADYINFNVSNGTIGNKTAGFTGTIEAAANGFYRCTATIASSLTSNQPVRYCVLSANSAARMPLFIGDTTSGVCFYGAQIEAGAFATSYIPTTTTALTRNADVATMTGTNFSSWYNASEGTFVLKAIMNGLVSGVSYEVVSASNGTIDNVIQYRPFANSATNAYMYANIRASAAAQASMLDPVLINTNSSFTQTISYKQDNFATALNGNTIVVDTSGIVPTVNKLTFATDTGSGAVNLCCYIQKLFYYPQRLTNAENQAFSK